MQKMRSLSAAGLAVFCCALASVVCPSASAAEARLLVRNATIFDATGKDPYTADVLIENGRFASIGENLPAPDDAQIVNAEGLSLLPGLIDVHVHWTNADNMTRADVATALLLSGVTTATDFHSAPESFGPKRDWSENLISPHVLFTARMGTPGGHGADWGDENMTRQAISPQEARAAVQALRPYKPDVIKVFADGWRYGSGIDNASMNENALAAIVEEAGADGLPVVTHTVSVERAKAAARAGVTAIVHAVQDKRADDELVGLMRDRNVIYAPTLAVYEPRPDKMAEVTDETQRRRIQARQDFSRYNLNRFVKGGVRIALGTDSGIASTPFGESSLRELELLVDFGLSPEAALIAGTAGSAAVLTLENDRGTIEAGKRADFVLVRGKPWRRISDYRNLEYVFLDGRLAARAGALAAGQGAPEPPAAAASRLIDDFERDDEKTAGGAKRLFDVDAGFPRSAIISQRVPKASGDRALNISAKMAVKTAPHAFVALPLSPGGFAPADASAYQGVRFDARGEGAYAVEIATRSGSAMKHFDAGRVWRKVEVNFSEFHTASEETRISLEAVYAVKIGARRDAGEAFWLEIDDVEFF